MSPSEYIAEYHNFRVLSADLIVSSTISRYQAAADPLQRPEFQAVASRLITKFKAGGTNPYSMPRRFRLIGHPLISEYEYFFREGLKRAYDCRGTPEEIRDAVRLAVATGRCDAAGAPAYITKWFGLDCNTLVDNWMGLSSGTAIFAYVNGYTGGPLNSEAAGGTNADEATRGSLPFPAAPTLQSVGEGSVLVTYSPDRPPPANGPKNELRFWEHIALVQSFSVISEDDPSQAKKGVPITAKASITIVEWGGAGGEAEHVKNVASCDLVKGKWVRGKDQVFWAIKAGASYRLILNMPPDIAAGERRKYGVPGHPEL
jgi:hypothetical protein